MLKYPYIISVWTLALWRSVLVCPVVCQISINTSIDICDFNLPIVDSLSSSRQTTRYCIKINPTGDQFLFTCAMSRDRISIYINLNRRRVSGESAPRLLITDACEVTRIFTVETASQPIELFSCLINAIA